MKWGLSSADLGQLFPAYLFVDPEMRILEAGPSIVRHLPAAVPGAALADIFSAPVPITYELLRRRRASDRILTLATPSGLTLQGAAIPQGRGFLLCLNHLTSNVTKKGWRLDFSDFSPGDSALAGLVLIAVQKALLGETRQAMVSLTQANAALRSAMEAQSAFLANMSHEIRTPLASIIGFSDLLTLEELSDPASRYVRRLTTASANLAALVDNVLDYSAIESGQISITNAPLSPHGLLSEIAAIHRPAATKKGLTLNLQIAPNLPAELVSDAGRLAQVINNLLSNAIKFSGRGVVVLGACYDEGESVLTVEVADEGPGIRPEDRHRLFKRFSQLHESKSRETGGTGLGLAISHGIADAMGARLELLVSPPPGARFRLTVPVRRAVPTGGIARQLAASAACWGRILLVDDTADNRELFVTILGRFADEIVTADAGTQGLALAQSRPFDLVILDIHMPDMDGLTIIRALRGEGPNRNTPIIALSADVTQSTISESLAAGADAFLPKPIRANDLIDGLRRHLAACGAMVAT